MNKTRSLLVIMMSAAAVALAEPAAPTTPAAPPPPPAPGGSVEGPRAGAPGNPGMLQERMRRFMSGDSEGMILKMLSNDSHMVQELGLTDAQVKEIKEAMAGSEQELKDLNDKLVQAGMRQVDLLKADTLDEEALMKAVQESGELRTQIAKLRIKQVIAAHKVLTPEQRAKLRETMKQRMEQVQQRVKEGGAALRARQNGAGPGHANQGHAAATGATAPQPPAPPVAQ